MTEYVGVRARLNTHITEIARQLIGQPNAALSTPGQLRYGKKGSLAIEISGVKAGCWFDHEVGIGGDALGLIRHRLGCAEFDAYRWGYDFLRSTHQAEQTKVGQIIQTCEPITGTPGEQYLRNRGITIGLPDCIRFRPNAYNCYGAVTALATDSDGNVLAVHQIYVTAEGQKAPLEVVKRTNKLIDGWSEKAAVRLPGTRPIVLAEGIETALSIWQATGYETWACLGISNIGHAPVPRGAEVVIASDGDAANSSAAEQLHKAMIKLRNRSVVVHLAEPPSGKDFNDVLLKDGAVAVLAEIDAASFTPVYWKDLEPKQAPKEDKCTQSGVVIDLAEKRAAEPAQSRPNGADPQAGQPQQVPHAGRQKAADILIGLAEEGGLFRTPDGAAYADLTIHNHRETWPIRSKGFKRWLSRRFYEETGGAPNSEAVQSALNVIEARAHFDGPEQRVNVRVAGLDDRIYLDLCDKDWRAIEIDEDGWRLEDNPPVKFRRAPGMLPLPVPEPGRSISGLRPFLNERSDEEFTLSVSWLLAALLNKGPYPPLAVAGEQGSAKTTFCEVHRALVDPAEPALRGLPREERDLFIAATNAHLLAFDNVSHIPPWIADALCRLATGGGFAVRQLYSDGDEVLFNAQRPVILNGIEEIIERPDLADRTIFVTLEPIPESRRRPEKEFWSDFERARPQLLGALLDAMVGGLRTLPDVKLQRLPRMADFALWATACETAIGPKGSFACAYGGNRDLAVESVIEGDAVAQAVRAFMARKQIWNGTATDLLRDLSNAVDERTHNDKRWPKDPKALSGRLRRAAPFLRKLGLEIGFERLGRARTRTVHITAHPSPDSADIEASAASATSVISQKPRPTRGLINSSLWTMGSDADVLGE